MPLGAHDPRDASVASDTSARVGDVLERAEARAREIRERAERSASEARRTARHEAEGIAQEARRAAATAARARVHRIKQLQASIGDRAEALVEGLDGGEVTAARLEELVSALGQAADRVLAEVEGAGEAPRQRRHAGQPQPPSVAGPPRAREREPLSAGAAADADAGLARGADGGVGPLLGEGKPLPRARPGAPATARLRAPFPRAERAASTRGAETRAEPATDARAERSPRGAEPPPAPITDALPDGAPMVRKPKRSNPRFTAVMMAIQGSAREDVAAHLAREHGLEDSDELLDEVFGRADARA